MSNTVIKVENISKLYRLGEVGTGTISHDLNRWLAKIRGKEDPFALVGQVNDRTHKSESDYVWSLKDINFEVKQGEVLGIIGKNGAGKSTLLKLLSQITAPTTGEIKIKGRIAALLEVGTGMHPEMTARENIFLNGAIMGMRKVEIKAKFDEIIDFAGCAMYIDTPIKRFSSGMRVRLGFAVAAFLEPEILIVDEVLAVGDAEFQKKAIGKMQDVSSKEGRTVLFVSHNMAAVKSLCTQGIILHNGSLVFSGTSEDAIEKYVHTSNSLAEIPINERTDRKGNGKIKISDIKFVNKNGIYVSELTSGEYYKIQIHFNKYQNIDIEKLFFGLQFMNENDEIVTTIATDEQGTTFTEIADNGYFEVEIPRLIFREGQYRVYFMVSEKMSFKADHVMMDSMLNAVVMNVIRGDYWKSGMLNRPKGFIQESSVKIINKP